jgi:hypothetical protein
MIKNFKRLVNLLEKNNFTITERLDNVPTDEVWLLKAERDCVIIEVLYIIIEDRFKLYPNRNSRHINNLSFKKYTDMLKYLELLLK